MELSRSLSLTKILQSKHFSRIYKKLQRNIKNELNIAIRDVAVTPSIGQQKLGDLKGIRVYKFKFKTQLYLLAYRCIDKNTIYLEAFGSHENFYKNLK